MCIGCSDVVKYLLSFGLLPRDIREAYILAKRNNKQDIMKLFISIDPSLKDYNEVFV